MGEMGEIGWESKFAEKSRNSGDLCVPFIGVDTKVSVNDPLRLSGDPSDGLVPVTLVSQVRSGSTGIGSIGVTGVDVGLETDCFL